MLKFRIFQTKCSKLGAQKTSKSIENNLPHFQTTEIEKNAHVLKIGKFRRNRIDEVVFGLLVKVGVTNGILEFDFVEIRRKTSNSQLESFKKIICQKPIR